MAAPGDLVPGLRELAAELGVVVDLSVEGDDEPSAGTVHRLVTGRREIHDRKAPVPQSYASRLINPDAFIIGSAVRQRSGHRADVTLRKTSGTKDAGYMGSR